MPKSTLAMDGRSFTHSPRILGGNVHNDPLFQFYYTAAPDQLPVRHRPPWHDRSLGHLHDLGIHTGGWA